MKIVESHYITRSLTVKHKKVSLVYPEASRWLDREPSMKLLVHITVQKATIKQQSTSMYYCMSKTNNDRLNYDL